MEVCCKGGGSCLAPLLGKAARGEKVFHSKVIATKVAEEGTLSDQETAKKGVLLKKVGAVVRGAI